MKKKYLFALAVTYILYAIAVITVNNLIGDILSPTLTFISLCFVYNGFVKNEKNIIYKLSGLFYALSLFAWFIFDFFWGISTLILQVNPENNLFIEY